MADRVVCQMCSWSGKSGPGRAWAAWHWTFVDGTSQLLCGRHKTQAMRAGGFGQPISELRGLVVAAPTVDKNLADAARPLTIVQQVVMSMRTQIRAELRQYLRGAVLHVDFADDGEVGLPARSMKPRTRRRAS